MPMLLAPVAPSAPAPEPLEQRRSRCAHARSTMTASLVAKSQRGHHCNPRETTRASEVPVASVVAPALSLASTRASVRALARVSAWVRVKLVAWASVQVAAQTSVQSPRVVVVVVCCRAQRLGIRRSDAHNTKPFCAQTNLPSSWQSPVGNHGIRWSRLVAVLLQQTPWGIRKDPPGSRHVRARSTTPSSLKTTRRGHVLGTPARN
mmetsp:Transcript_41785/g.105025  ORF Transcript_41785/g.105025 Transcript_41785/m.105025 type:complete len:206 (+) Transcript_41785:569-1186(+)